MEVFLQECHDKMFLNVNPFCGTFIIIEFVGIFLIFNYKLFICFVLNLKIILAIFI